MDLCTGKITACPNEGSEHDCQDWYYYELLCDECIADYHGAGNYSYIGAT